MNACLAVTCHLHFWQNDLDLVRATAVTRGWNGYRDKSQRRKLILEKEILPLLLLTGTQTNGLSLLCPPSREAPAADVCGVVSRGWLRHRQHLRQHPGEGSLGRRLRSSSGLRGRHSQLRESLPFVFFSFASAPHAYQHTETEAHTPTHPPTHTHTHTHKLRPRVLSWAMNNGGKLAAPGKGKKTHKLG